MANSTSKSASGASTQQRIRDAVSRAKAAGAATEAKLRTKLSSIADLQSEMALALADKTADPALLKKRLVSLSGAINRLVSPYRAK